MVQLSDGKGDAPCVQLARPAYDAPNLKRLLTDPKILKLFHFGRFDIAMLFYLQSWGGDRSRSTAPRSRSKLARTYTDRHGLKERLPGAAGRGYSKAQQSSPDWGAAKLSDEAQIAYAASDVLHLQRPARKPGRHAGPRRPRRPGQRLFRLLPHRAILDVTGWEEVDIFAHA